MCSLSVIVPSGNYGVHYVSRVSAAAIVKNKLFRQGKAFASSNLCTQDRYKHIVIKHYILPILKVDK